MSSIKTSPTLKALAINVIALILGDRVRALVRVALRNTNRSKSIDLSTSDQRSIVGNSSDVILSIKSLR
jgi:hypothetical protein